MLYCEGVFFFQAEDGIRDLVRSRGLGDVYKRQDLDFVHLVRDDDADGLASRRLFLIQEVQRHRQTPVSYTHLTLPTIYSV